jgi:hypothetical protein
VAVVLVLAAAAPAHAQGDREAERTGLYREGVKLADQGRWAEALVKFRQVVAIRPAPPALFTLAQAEERVGKLVEAHEAYGKALTEARAVGSAAVAAAAQRGMTALEPRLARITLRAPAGLPGTQATIDGSPAALGATTPLDPGDHVVAARAEGRRPFQRTMHVAEGQAIELTITLDVEPSAPAASQVSTSNAPAPAASDKPAAPPTAPEEPAAPTSPAEREKPEASTGSSFPLGAVVLGGAGVAAGVVGLVVRLVGQSDYDSAQSSCPAKLCPSQSLVDTGNSGRDRVIAGTYVLGAGIAAIAVAGVWWVLGRSKTQDVALVTSLRGADLVGHF